MTSPTTSAYRGFAQGLIVGHDSIKLLRSELSRYSCRRVALFSSPSVLDGATFARVRAALSDVEIALIESDIRPHAPIADTEALAEQLRGFDIDAFVTVGGGSVSDTAKACAILLSEGGHLEDHCSSFTPPDQLLQPPLPGPKIPIFAVPTSLSGAEMTPGGAATDSTGTKRTFWDPKIASRLVIFDSMALSETPPEILVTTAMNGLAHCAEGIYSKTKNPVSTALALQGARQFTSGLLKHLEAPGNSETLLTLGEAAAFGGMVISHARVGLHHAICHVLGASCGVPHGVANSIMLPHVLEYNEGATMPEQSQLSGAMIGGFTDAGYDLPELTWQAQDAVSASVLVTRLRNLLGAPRSLREAGVAESSLEEVAERTTFDRGLYFNPRPVNGSRDVLDILWRAWHDDSNNHMTAGTY